MMRDDAHVLSVLVELGLEINLGKALSSVTNVLRGSKPGAVVLLRADMDALPVIEATDGPMGLTHPFCN